MPPELLALLERYGFGKVPFEVEHYDRGGEWRVRAGERVLRWAEDEAEMAPHILRDAAMLAVLERHQLVAPRLLALDQARGAGVMSLQSLLMPGALWDVGEVGLEEEGWRSLGRYIRAFHERLRLPDFDKVDQERAWETDLKELEHKGRVTASDARWLRHWRLLLPSDIPRVVTHGLVAPSWIVAHPDRQLVLALTDWSIAEYREPGHDLLRLPQEVLEPVLKGYGPGAWPRFLQAKLTQLVDQACGHLREGEATPAGSEPGSLGEEFYAVLQRSGLQRLRS